MRYWLAASLLVIVLLAGVWDIWVTASGTPEETVSAVLHQWSLAYPVLPLALGIILGHIFWPHAWARQVGITVK